MAVPRFNPLQLIARVSSWGYHAVLYTVYAAVFLVAAVVLGLRWWLLPNIETYRESIASAVTRAVGQKITIGRIAADWEGMRPQLELGDVRIHDAQGRPALVLERVDTTLSWWSLAAASLRFHTLEIYQPRLVVRRSSAGVVSVGGVDMDNSTEGGGLTDWLLGQREIVVRDATVAWIDDMLAAPRLDLRRVTFQLVNDDGRHRFGLRADAPAELAAPLDVRGEATGDSIRDPGRWKGQLFVQLDYADIGAWRQWVPFPVDIPRGKGAVRTWVSFDHRMLRSVVADVRLADVRTRVSPQVAELELRSLEGRIAWRRLAGGWEVVTSRLGLATASDLVLPPSDLTLRVVDRTTSRPATGELKVDGLELGALARLAGYLPFPAELRSRLDAYSPRGNLLDVSARWTGELPRPEHYALKGRFSGVGIKAQGAVPGFDGISGSLDFTEKGGDLQIASQGSRLDLPLAMPEPIPLDQLNAHVSWTVGREQVDVRLRDAAYSNAHLAGTASGTWRSMPRGGGMIDLTAALSRADARQVPRYIPLVIGPVTREWVTSAVVAGSSNDVKLRLRGNLEEFPFEDPKRGLFEVAFRVNGGVLAYAEGWPRLENITADVVFRGKTVEVLARDGAIHGARIQKARAFIADLVHRNELLEVNGEAEGPTADFLRFVEESPVNTMIDRFTEGMRAQGRGRLGIRIDLPLRNRRDTRIAGTYQFSGNQIVADPGLPTLEQATGRLEFTDSSVRMQNVATVIAGGPATLAAATSTDGGVRITVQGKSTLEALRRAFESPLLASGRGTADWRASLVLRRKVADLVIESGLQGVAIDLPAPLGKAAADAMPLRIERVVTAPRADRLYVHYGSVLSAQLQRRHEGERVIIERAAVQLGEPAARQPPAEGAERPWVPALPERNGIVVAGTAASIHLDQWRVHPLVAPERGDKAGAEATVLPDLLSVDVKAAGVDAFDRRFHDAAVRLSQQGGTWTGVVSAREGRGEVTWRPQGRGRLVARFGQLDLPAANTTPRAAAANDAGGPRRAMELPAVDVVVERLQVKDRALGKLEVVAVPDGADWRIERFSVTNPDGSLTGDGLWRVQTSQPRTQLNLKLDVKDAGKLLSRLGYPEGVRGGVAKVDGSIGWNGAPQDVDYATMSGNLLLEAQKGRFAKLDPGIGKLLSILSLQALPRRITLDFKDVFSDGFEFDEIVGSLKMARGVASTDNFRIQGSAARIQMSGDVDFNTETQKLRVRVTPSVGDSVATVTGLLGGPLAGLGVFLAQKILNDPLGKLAAYEYGLTGTWADPQVTKLAVEVPTEGERK